MNETSAVMYDRLQDYNNFESQLKPRFSRRELASAFLSET